MNNHQRFTQEELKTLDAIANNLSIQEGQYITLETYSLDGDEWAAFCIPVDGVPEAMLTVQLTQPDHGRCVLIDHEGRAMSAVLTGVDLISIG